MIHSGLIRVLMVLLGLGIIFGTKQVTGPQASFLSGVVIFILVASVIFCIHGIFYEYQSVNFIELSKHTTIGWLFKSPAFAMEEAERGRSRMDRTPHQHLPYTVPRKHRALQENERNKTAKPIAPIKEPASGGAPGSRARMNPWAPEAAVYRRREVLYMVTAACKSQPYDSNGIGAWWGEVIWRPFRHEGVL
ncbi:hypothetical protein BDK51DRAFT_27199 [Blyttiomyces helicus]|uniref:Uncharacterized protein n=1 Tax=Blyttiomyces helicus TaxID=388810 RepID=A0A4P9W808_9FUNG|nr:hypothetical protein BDK51DRAFT_27199 [Blyttiomyces helicus]|eukprot:RKO88232.1 hypothetical protein BDK51DRAFT_27199 [Blyttiomyces helicus]